MQFLLFDQETLKVAVLPDWVDYSASTDLPYPFHARCTEPVAPSAGP